MSSTRPSAPVFLRVTALSSGIGPRELVETWALYCMNANQWPLLQELLDCISHRLHLSFGQRREHRQAQDAFAVIFGTRQRNRRAVQIGNRRLKMIRHWIMYAR